MQKETPTSLGNLVANLVLNLVDCNTLNFTKYGRVFRPVPARSTLFPYPLPFISRPAGTLCHFCSFHPWYCGAIRGLLFLSCSCSFTSVQLSVLLGDLCGPSSLPILRRSVFETQFANPLAVLDCCSVGHEVEFLPEIEGQALGTLRIH